MTIIDKIERQINSLAIDEVVPFSYIKLKDVSKDTIRKYLHRLHDRGLISIVKRAYFKKIEPFNEFFLYMAL